MQTQKRVVINERNNVYLDYRTDSYSEKVYLMFSDRP
jgi:hypothetical protein